MVDHLPSVVALVEPMESMVTSMVLGLKALNPQVPAPTEICLRHPRKHPPELYAEVLGPSVRFEAEWYEIAFMLGYGDPRTFYRNFRRWTGDNPTAYRQAHQLGH